MKEKFVTFIITIERYRGVLMYVFPSKVCVCVLEVVKYNETHNQI